MDNENDFNKFSNILRGKPSDYVREELKNNILMLLKIQKI